VQGCNLRNGGGQTLVPSGAAKAASKTIKAKAGPAPLAVFSFPRAETPRGARAHLLSCRASCRRHAFSMTERSDR
jgi:hypothetical protein